MRRRPPTPDAVRAKIDELCRQGRIIQMKEFPQHGTTSTYDHVRSVATTSISLARALRLKVSDIELLRGALLHDYYLYDWHDPASKGHATQHPLRALRQADVDFKLTDRERNIIASHMWPLPPTRIPTCREAWLVCTADKLCAFQETVRRF
jgi:uncharacterized protein